MQLLLLLLLFVQAAAHGTRNVMSRSLADSNSNSENSAYISEVFYKKSKSRDFIEVAVPQGSGSSYSLYIYDDDGEIKVSYGLGSIVKSVNGYDVHLVNKDRTSNFKSLDKDQAIALIRDGSYVVQLISFEERITADEGPASGVKSTKLGHTSGSGDDIFYTEDEGDTYETAEVGTPGVLSALEYYSTEARGFFSEVSYEKQFMEISLPESARSSDYSVIVYKNNGKEVFRYQSLGGSYMSTGAFDIYLLSETVTSEWMDLKHYHGIALVNSGMVDEFISFDDPVTIEEGDFVGLSSNRLGKTNGAFYTENAGETYESTFQFTMGWVPTKAPTPSPTGSPTTSPTRGPTEHPTLDPTPSPTKHPSLAPTPGPTEHMTPAPTPSPTEHPTQSPTSGSTGNPTPSPTWHPTSSPTRRPTWHPTPAPTPGPTVQPELLPDGCMTTSPAVWNPENGLESDHYCGSDHPAPDQLEKEAAEIRAFVEKESAEGTRRLCAGCITIETHFHIVADKNGNSGDLEDWQVIAQISKLNLDFAGSAFKFELANTTRTFDNDWYKLNGNRFSNDIPTMQSAFGNTLRAGDGSRMVLNIYTLRLRSLGLGVSTFPTAFAGAKDGVFIDHCTIPSGDGCAGFNTGDILVHEVGHWLGLLHTFEGGCNAEQGDYIQDTPAQALPNFSCPAPGKAEDSCPCLPGDDPLNNTMGYSIDCYAGFTYGQKLRMYDQWKLYREGVALCKGDEGIFTVEITTDDKPEDNFWRLYHANGQLISMGEFGAFEEHVTQIADICLQYDIPVYFGLGDDGSDGLSGQNSSFRVLMDGRPLKDDTTFNRWSGVAFTTRSSPTCDNDDAFVVVELVLDYKPSETSWKIVDSNDIPVYVESDYTLRGTTEYFEGASVWREMCIPRTGFYFFVIEDSGGDGFSMIRSDDSPYFQVSVDGNVAVREDQFADRFEWILDLAKAPSSAPTQHSTPEPTPSPTPHPISTAPVAPAPVCISFDNAGNGVPLADGDTVSMEWYAKYGMTISVKSSFIGGYDVTPRIFDTSRTQSLEQGLESPNGSCGGTGVGDGGLPGELGENCEPQGNVLIIQESAADDPDPRPDGGVFVFDFSACPVEKLDSLGLMNLDDEGWDGVIIINREKIIRVGGLGTNSIQDAPINGESNVQSVEILVFNNAAVRNICFLPATDCI